MYTVHVHDKINVHVQLRIANRADLSRHTCKCLATMPLPQVVLYTSTCIPTVIHVYVH